MVHFSITIADKVVAVSAIFDAVREYCRDYLTEEPADCFLTLTPEDLMKEREKAAREDALEGLPVRNLPDDLLEITALQRKIVEECFSWNILLFHGSVVAVDDEAYLFTAKSGTGKSTHTRLWREVFGQRAVMVNDDKPFLQITEHGVLAHGSPWNGKHRLGQNISVPLKAICILERGVENAICPILPKEALQMLLQQSQRPGNARNLPRYLEMLDKLSGQVNFYRMQCNMNPAAAELAYEVMSGGPGKHSGCVAKPRRRD